MQKITKRTRIRLGRRFRDAFNPIDYGSGANMNLYYVGYGSYTSILSRAYDLQYSTRRNGIHYFIPRNEQKLTLFLLKYGQYVLNKGSR